MLYQHRGEGTKSYSSKKKASSRFSQLGGEGKRKVKTSSEKPNLLGPSLEYSGPGRYLKSVPYGGMLRTSTGSY